MVTTPLQAEAEGREQAADDGAGAALLAAVAIGAVLSLLQPALAGWTLNTWPLHFLLPMLVPGLLHIGAWACCARHESRLGLRRQRGALALLAGAAVFTGLLTPAPGLLFGTFAGPALLLLALRLRSPRVAAAGVQVTAATVVLLWSGLPGGYDGPWGPGAWAAVILGLTAVACGILAWQLFRRGVRKTGGAGSARAR